MADTHGITIAEISSGQQAATTVSTSVIGIVGIGGLTPDAAKYPLNTPVHLIDYASINTDLGGNLAQAIHDIYRQTRAEIVVVRVDSSTDIGNATDDGKGLYALKSAQSITRYKPKIILAPGYGEAEFVSLKAVANSLRALAIVDLDSADVATAVADATTLAADGSSRCMAIWPQIRAEAGGTARSAAPFVAGAIAGKDAIRGYWWSPSNTAISGIAELAVNVSDDDAEVLNDAKIATFRRFPAQQTIWGNKSLYVTGSDVSDGDSYQFVAVRRVADAIYDTLDRSLAWAQDRPISANLVNDIQEYVNAYMATLRAQGAILNGKCVIDPSRNPISALVNGILTVDLDFEPPAPAELISIRATRNEDYYEEVVT